MWDLWSYPSGCYLAPFPRTHIHTHPCTQNRVLHPEGGDQQLFTWNRFIHLSLCFLTLVPPQASLYPIQGTLKNPGISLIQSPNSFFHSSHKSYHITLLGSHLSVWKVTWRSGPAGWRWWISCHLWSWYPSGAPWQVSGSQGRDLFPWLAYCAFVFLGMRPYSHNLTHTSTFSIQQKEKNVFSGHLSVSKQEIHCTWGPSMFLSPHQRVPYFHYS